MFHALEPSVCCEGIGGSELCAEGEDRSSARKERIGLQLLVRLKKELLLVNLRGGRTRRRSVRVRYQGEIGSVRMLDIGLQLPNKL